MSDSTNNTIGYKVTLVLGAWISNPEAADKKLIAETSPNVLGKQLSAVLVVDGQSDELLQLIKTNSDKEVFVLGTIVVDEEITNESV